jgi:hypothetical protein
LHENDTIAPATFPSAKIVERCWPPAGNPAEPVSVRDAALLRIRGSESGAHPVLARFICIFRRWSRATIRMALRVLRHVAETQQPQFA